ncbi:hypothetical protein EGW08_017089 [Elysia chlorotica]|uniref:Apple domain-containing protein n=1 Tax=Elysia chlorotica TaxID=188477 RepID=A0A433T0T6_ELYCH|nr:hypothetical protein EGW08_017089 [Elysia chlorotica]
MELNIWVLLHTIPTAIVLRHTVGVMFDFHLTEKKFNFTLQDHNCKSLGYDGLAIVSTPEAFEYAIKITYYIRTVLGLNAFVGNRYYADQGQFLWDDGSVPRSDLPLRNPNGHEPYVRLRNFGVFERGWGTWLQPGLCGNHDNPPKQSSASGSIKHGEQLQTTTRTVLSEGTVLSHLECFVLCGMDPQCRSAEFNSDLLTCAILGEYKSSGTTSNAHVRTFVRQTF